MRCPESSATSRQFPSDLPLPACQKWHFSAAISIACSQILGDAHEFAYWNSARIRFPLANHPSVVNIKPLGQLTKVKIFHRTFSTFTVNLSTENKMLAWFCMPHIMNLQLWQTKVFISGGKPGLRQSTSTGNIINPFFF